MDVISKELASLVLGKDIYRTFYSVSGKPKTLIMYQYFIDKKTNNRTDEMLINIYELANRCKHWALTKGYTIASMITNENTVVYVNLVIKGNAARLPIKFKVKKIENWSSQDVREPEAIIAMCEWIFKKGK